MNAPEEIVPWQARKRHRSSQKHRQLRIVFAACGVAILLFVGMQWRQTEAARVSAASILSVPHTPSSPSEYYPSQYQNSARSGTPEEHIPAF
jgi:hypothetical protein